jgi:hypothetical protein
MGTSKRRVEALVCIRVSTPMIIMETTVRRARQMPTYRESNANHADSKSQEVSSDFAESALSLVWRKA